MNTDNLVQEIAEALQERMSKGTSGRWIADWGETPGALAVAVLPLVSREITKAKAEGWDEGYSTCLGDFDIAARREARSTNPYRESE